MTTMQEYGQQVRAAREAQQATQAAIATAIGAHTSYIHQVEKGKFKNISTRRAQAIERVLGVPVPTDWDDSEADLASSLEREFETRWTQLAPDGPRYETEVEFDARRKWRFDVAWPEMKVAVELHGGETSGGRHVRGPGFTEDRQKMNAAQLDGWIVLEFPGGLFRRDPAGCIDLVRAALRQRREEHPV